MSTSWNADANALFVQAIEIESADDRQAFIDEACQDNSQLRAYLERLLRAHSDAGSFLNRPAGGFAPTIATNEFDTVDEGVAEISLDFLQPSDKPGCLGTLAAYEVIQVVGRGGMGLVLRSHDPKLNRVVAIKVMAPELAANAMAVKRFLREARAAAAVSHDHVVTIHAIEEMHRPPFIVMEYVDGQSLQEKIDHTGSFELTEILRIGLQIARGLSAAHEQGLVHRDIKPANILLENGVERVKLTDFGLARAVDDVSVTQTGQIAGTPQYMSPEQAQGDPIDARSDLFSLGSVLYTLCTGRPPFRAESPLAMLRRVTDDTPRPIREVNPDMPDWLCEIIDKLLQKDPRRRFDSAAHVADLLGQHLAHIQHPTTAPQPARVGVSVPQKNLALQIKQTINFLWAAGILSLVIGMLAVCSLLGLTIGEGQPPSLLIVSGFLSLPLSLLIMIAAHRAERDSSYRAAITAAYLALLPVNPYLICTLPITIWTVLWLRRAEVQAEFLKDDWSNVRLSMFGGMHRSRGFVRASRWATVAMVVLGVLAVVIYIKVNQGTIRVEVNDPDTTVTIDGQTGINLQNGTAGSLTVQGGEHQLLIRQGELEFQTDSFRVKRGEDVLVRVELIDGKLAARLVRPEIDGHDGKTVTPQSDEVIGMQTQMATESSANPLDENMGTPQALSPESQVLDRWIGGWELELRERPTPRFPAVSSSYSVQYTRVLNNRYLQSHLVSESGAEQHFSLLTFDQWQGYYRKWLFTTSGDVAEYGGKWDDVDAKMAWQSKPGPGQNSSTLSERFVDRGRRETNLIVRGDDRQVIREIQGTALMSRNLSTTELPVAAGPLEEPEQLAQLARLAGDWSLDSTFRPSVAEPKGNEEATRERVRWVLGGRFLMGQSFVADTRMILVWLMTYDADQSAYWYWVFHENGAVGKWRVTWDSAAKTYHYHAVELPEGWIGTGFQRWIADDTLDRSIVIKDEQGRVLMDMTQQQRRSKVPAGANE